MSVLIRWQAWIHCWEGAFKPVCLLGGRRGYTAIRWQGWIHWWAGACERVCLLGSRCGYTAERAHLSGCAC